MGEIKSAIELAMEKTKHLKLSKEEAQQLREEELDQQAEGMVNRYFSGQVDTEQLEEKLAELKGTTFPYFLISRFARTITLDSDPGPAFEILKVIVKHYYPERLHVIEEMEKTYERFAAKKKELHQSVAAELEDELRRQGFSGSAVVPHVEASVIWLQAIKNLMERYEGEFVNLREQLLHNLR